MKCRVCKGPAVIDVRRHNAAFCKDHFVHHCDEQVRKAIHSHRMLEPGTTFWQASHKGMAPLLARIARSTVSRRP